MSARALIAMSGGVDSSVAAFLTQQAGYDCTGATMRLFNDEDSAGGHEGAAGRMSARAAADGRATARTAEALTTAAAAAGYNEGGCCSLADVEDARAVCNRLGIPFYVFNFTDSFAEQVIDRFIAAYEQGRTPNPCIDCNRFLKFERLLERARQTNFDHVVTGHYARRSHDEQTGRYLLRRGIDRDKDQSYVLYAMTQEQLARTLLPLGELNKAQARAIAREQGLITADKRESQDICFVPNGDYGAFIRRYTGRVFADGEIVNACGERLGTHSGIIGFTIGQRKGIGIASAQPLYVSGIDAVAQRVIVGKEDELYRRRVLVHDINLIAYEHIVHPLEATAKHRYRTADAAVTVTQLDDDTLEVVFDEPQKAVAPGQALVVYKGDLVVGGGTIAEVE
jgi:tRNA-specific 2-thiouridylase